MPRRGVVLGREGGVEEKGAEEGEQEEVEEEEAAEQVGRVLGRE